MANSRKGGGQNTRNGNYGAGSARINTNSSGMPSMNSTGQSRSTTMKTTRISGSDYIGPLSVEGVPDNLNRIRQTFPVSPSYYPGTRLTQLADLWERYRFSKFTVRFVPSVPTSLACQLVMYIDTDPDDNPSTIVTADVLIRQAVAQGGSQQWNFNLPKSTSIMARPDDQLYYTGVTNTDSRFNMQGKIYVIQVTSAINFNGEPLGSSFVCGSLFIDWEIDLSTPQINPDFIAAISPPPVVLSFADGELLLLNTDPVTGLDPSFEYVVYVEYKALGGPTVELPNGRGTIRYGGTENGFDLFGTGESIIFAPVNPTGLIPSLTGTLTTVIDENFGVLKPQIEDIVLTFYPTRRIR